MEAASTVLLRRNTPAAVSPLPPSPLLVLLLLFVELADVLVADRATIDIPVLCLPRALKTRAADPLLLLLLLLLLVLLLLLTADVCADVSEARCARGPADVDVDVVVVVEPAIRWPVVATDDAAVDVDVAGTAAVDVERAVADVEEDEGTPCDEEELLVVVVVGVTPRWRRDMKEAGRGRRSISDFPLHRPSSMYVA